MQHHHKGYRGTGCSYALMSDFKVLLYMYLVDKGKLRQSLIMAVMDICGHILLGIEQALMLHSVSNCSLHVALVIS